MKNPRALSAIRQPEAVDPLLDDSACLLLAVGTRLRQAAAGHPLAAPCRCTDKPPALPPGTPAAAEELARLRHLMLESARALEQLHSSLAETGLPQRLRLP